MGSRKNKDGIYVVSDYIECDRYSFEGTASDVKAYIDHIVEKASKDGMVDEGKFDFNVYSSYYDSAELTIKYYFDRVENEKERNKREKEESAVKAAAAAKRRKAAEKAKLKNDADYAKYLELKKKFES
jgi:hypothetical protein